MATTGLFTVGSTIRFKSGSYNNPCSRADGLYTIKCVQGGNLYLSNRGVSGEAQGTDCPCGKHTWIFHEGDVDLVESKSPITNMSLLEKAKLAFKSEPEKSFIKVGVMDSQENLTTEGTALLLQFLLEKNKDVFKTEIVDPILKEIEDEKCK